LSVSLTMYSTDGRNKMIETFIVALIVFLVV